jgi:hypothetical protein
VAESTILGRLGGIGLAVLVSASGCDGPKSVTSLNPEGPPEVLQVFVYELVDSPGYSLCPRSSRPYCPQLAYGDHGAVPMEYDDRSVTTAAVGASQKLRLVLDELLVGNNLEEIQCKNNTWSRVPPGATPDDIAACAGPQQIIANTCTGPHAVCLDPASGVPIGVMDVNLDGAVDDTRFINGAVRISCDGVDIPLDLQGSFYQPSGNQFIPAGGQGVDGLGPALVLVPANGVRTSADCVIEFDESVVDKDGNRVCAPAQGARCVAGVTDGIGFSTEELKVTGTAPGNGNIAVNPDGVAQILINFNARIDMANLGTVVVTADGAAVENIDVTLYQNPGTMLVDETRLSVVLGDGYRAETDYEVTISGTQERFGGALPAEYRFMFATRMGVADAGVPDAVVADAAVADAAVADAGVADAAVVDAAAVDAAP